MIVRLALIAAILGGLVLVVGVKHWQYRSCIDQDHLSRGTCIGIISR